MSEELKKGPEGQEDGLAPEQTTGQVDEQTPEGEAPKEPIHWATRGQRVAAWIAAIGVIFITLAYIYSIYTGDLFGR